MIACLLQILALNSPLMPPRSYINMHLTNQVIQATSDQEEEQVPKWEPFFRRSTLPASLSNHDTVITT